MAEETQWLDPSPIGGEFSRHEAAMAPCAQVPVHKAFGLAPGFNVGLLRKMAEGYKPKKIAVIDHGENGFEIRRLLDSSDLKLFYQNIDKTNSVEATNDANAERIETIKKLLKQFFELNDADIAKYDPKAVAARLEGCISHSYISRRVTAMSAFRTSDEGATLALKAVITALDGNGLTRLTDSEANELFSSGALFYRVDRAKLA